MLTVSPAVDMAKELMIPMWIALLVQVCPLAIYAKKKGDQCFSIGRGVGTRGAEGALAPPILNSGEAQPPPIISTI